jgi:tetratricopeptide (TPR) repeat protein
MVRRRSLHVAVLVASLLGVSWGSSLALSGGSKDKEESKASAEEEVDDEALQAYERGMALVKEHRYQEALERFRVAVKKDKQSPEYLNMVAYTERKVGNLDDAFRDYAKVLAMKPDYAPAREYLGEAHLQAVLLQLDVLRGYGDKGKKEADALTAALQEAAKTLEAQPMGGELPSPDKKGW